MSRVWKNLDKSCSAATNVSDTIRKFIKVKGYPTYSSFYREYQDKFAFTYKTFKDRLANNRWSKPMLKQLSNVLEVDLFQLIK